MLNEMTLIREISKDLELKETLKGEKYCIVEFANIENVIPVSLRGAAAINTSKMAGSGSVISIRGRIEENVAEGKGEICVVGERATFIQGTRARNGTKNGIN